MDQSEDKKLGHLDKMERRKVGSVVANDLKIYARQRWPLTTDEWRRARLADLLGFSKRRVKSLYQGEPTAVLHAAELAAITELIGPKEEAKNDQTFAARLARVEAEIAATRAALARMQMARPGYVAHQPRRTSFVAGQGARNRRDADQSATDFDPDQIPLFGD